MLTKHKVVTPLFFVTDNFSKLIRDLLC